MRVCDVVLACSAAEIGALWFVGDPDVLCAAVTGGYG